MPNMHIPVSRDSDVPLYRQIEDWLRAAILGGQLEIGTRLPASRTLASGLGVSRATVEAAYGGLMADGLLDTRGSGGTVVAPLPSSSLTASPAGGFEASGTPRRQSRLVPPSTHRSDLIDFSGGGGDDSLFPFPGFLRGLKSRHGSDPGGWLGLPPPGGEPALRQAIARISASQGLLLQEDGILVTGGSQQAIALAAATLARPGDSVLVEEPSYGKAMALFRSMGLNVVGLPCDRQGPDPDAFSHLARTSGARFAYLIPNFRNPTGSCMGAGRRRQLASAAKELDLAILEDDFAGGLRYEGQSLPSMQVLCRPGSVIHTGTFSKLLAPGLCVGFLAAEGSILRRLRENQQWYGFSASRLFQRGLEDFITVGGYRNHLKRAIRLYRRRRDCLCAALARHLPDAAFSLPAGGLFLWIRLPRPVNPAEHAENCTRAGVRVAFGEDFFCSPDETSRYYLRLNFCQVAEADIEPGVIRLAGVLRQPATPVAYEAR